MARRHDYNYPDPFDDSKWVGREEHQQEAIRAALRRSGQAPATGGSISGDTHRHWGCVLVLVLVLLVTSTPVALLFT